MDLRGGDGDRNASGLLTTGRMRGGDAAGLGGDAASSSLFALQQVLQRDNSKAIASALASLVSRAYRRDYVVLDEWIRSSPRLAELFSKGSRDTELSGDRDARLMSTLRTFSVALDRISNDDHARDVWHRVSRDWSGIFVRCLRGGGAKHVGLCHAALDALQAFVRRVGAPSARVVASWMAGDADGASLWGELVRPTKHTATRTKAIHLTATILASTEKEAKLAVLDEARGIVPLILNGDTSHSNDYSVAAANRRLLESIANRCLRTEGDDGALRRACLRVCASEKGLASLRGLASKNQTRKAAVDLLGLIVLDPSWLEFASRKSSGVKEEHANAIRALDPAGDPKQLEILVAVLRAAPTLLVRWLATSSRSALCSPRPWDKGGEEGPSERSLAGCAAFRAVLRVPTTRILSAPQDEDFPPEHIINACLPPEDVLSKKELTRGVLHSHEKAKIAALEVILDVLERFAVEVKDLFDDDDWEDSTEVSDQLAAALERALAPEGNTRDDFLLVNKLYANCQTDEMIHLKHVKYDTRKFFQERLPDVQTLLNIVNNPNTTESVVSLALAALRRYCLTIPGAVKDVKWDILKAVANTAANLGTVPERDDRNALMLNQLAGLARVHPIDQTQRIRRPQRADKTAVKVRPILLAAVPRSAPIRALFDDAMIPITNSARERRIWLSELAKTAACEDSDDASSLFRLLERADKLKKLPPKAIDVTTNGLDCFNAAMQENTDYFWEHWEDDDDEDDTRYGLISPLVCAGLLLQGDERIAAMITRVVPNLVHTAGASDLRAIIALCQAVNTLSGKTTLRSFARSLEADLSVDGSTAVLETPTKIHSDEKMREGDASKEQLISMLTGKLGTPLLTPMSKRTLVYHSLRDEGDSSFRLLRQTITDVSFWLLVTHVCAPFTSGNDCVAETPWGAAVVKDAVEKIIASAGKDVCLDACRAAALGVARCSARGEARKVMRSAQRDLADYLLARKPDLTSTLDLDLCYGEDDPFTPLTILSRAHAAYASPEDLAVAAPRAMVIAETFVRSLNNPCYELTSYVSPSTASAALESAAARDMPPSVLKILQYSPRESRDISVLGTRALFELWLRHEDAPEIVDDILTPLARLNAHKLLYSPDDDLGQSVQACWETAKGPSVSRSRRRAAQSCAAALVATDSSARARLRQLIFREVENNCMHFTERFYPAIRSFQSPFHFSVLTHSFDR